MEIIENQYLSVKNVLSYLVRVTGKSISELIEHIKKNSEALDLAVVGKIMFSILDTHNIPDDIAMDIEVLVPVDKSFNSNGKYICKPEFKLENAIKIIHYGSYSELIKTQQKLKEFLLKNGIKAITKTYYVVEKNSGNNSIISLYVGTNGNIL